MVLVGNLVVSVNKRKKGPCGPFFISSSYSLKRRIELFLIFNAAF